MPLFVRPVPTVMAQSILNPPQRSAVEHIHGPLLVLAGAGSGKTRGITEKITHLVRRCHHDPAQVAAVTFTNKAAREMRKRVGQQLTGRAARGLTISTFHRLGLSLLRAEHELAGYKSNFSIFDAQDSLALIGELGGRDNAKRNQALISRCKSALCAPGEDEDTAPVANLFETYRRHLHAYNAVDFDDLIALPIQIMEQDPDALARWQARFRYMLVDECQDTNTAQYHLLRLLAGARRTFTVVVDDDQSVYAWRGARPENLARLREDFPTLEVIKLEQNYRSSTRILQAANRLIQVNTRLFEKNLWSQLGAGETLRVLPCANEQDEAERVVGEIMSQRIRTGGRGGDYAILYRSNLQSLAFERALRERNQAYYLSGGQSFFDKSEVKDVVAYLRLLVNPDDDAAFLRIINTPRREIGPATLEKLGDYAHERHAGLLQAAGEIRLTQRLKDRAGRRLDDFARLMETLAQSAEHRPAADVATQLLADVDYDSWLHQSAASWSQYERRQGNVADLRAWIARIAGDETGGELREVVNRLGLMDILERREQGGDDRVQLMTLHAAKGLEFPHVFLVGMEEGLLPHQNSVDAGTLEEERRLVYVGITRARRSLSLTYAKQRQRGREIVEREPSRFLEELAGDDLQWEGRPGQTASPEEQRVSGQRHLASLKDLLADG